MFEVHIEKENFFWHHLQSTISTACWQQIKWAMVMTQPEGPTVRNCHYCSDLGSILVQLLPDFTTSLDSTVLLQEFNQRRPDADKGGFSGESPRASTPSTAVGHHIGSYAWIFIGRMILSSYTKWRNFSCWTTAPVVSFVHPFRNADCCHLSNLLFHCFTHWYQPTRLLRV